MAYSAPPLWEHGDIPTAADMNKYSDGLTAIYNAINGKRHAPAARWRQYLSASADTHFLAVTTDNSYCVNIHTQRFLFYGGSGQLTNLAGTETTSLPDNTGGTNIFDLDSVGWLNYGLVYEITGVQWAFEDWEP
jgi:hypothetical protein